MKTRIYTISNSLNGYNYKQNGISCYVLNCTDLFLQVEKLATSLEKKYLKFGGLDLAYLEESSMLKAITRAARKELTRYGECWTMEEDLQARKHLTAFIFESVQYSCK